MMIKYLNEEIKRKIFRIDCSKDAKKAGTKFGTAFPISQNAILTAYHIIENYIEKRHEYGFIIIEFEPGKIEIIFGPDDYNEEKIIFDKKLDIAVLILNRTINVEPFRLAKIGKKEFPNITAETYGFPSIEEHDAGTPLSLTVIQANLKADKYDIEISEKFREEKYNGFSGAPIIAYNSVIGTINYDSKVEEYLLGRSFDTIEKFFIDNNIDIQIEPIVLAPNVLNYLDKIVENNKIIISKDTFQYQETYATWESLDDIYSEDKKIGKPSKIEELIEEFYIYKKSEEEKPEEKVNTILFLIANFGEGKSSFMKNYASELSKDYLSGKTDLFPIYINLNVYENFKEKNHKYGFIYSYLVSRKIYLEDAGLTNFKFSLILDSFDEATQLNQKDLEELIHDITKINQFIEDKKESPLESRIIIASRPIEHGIQYFIEKYGSYKNPEMNKERTYILLYGFKEEQFNSFISNALEKNIFDKIKDPNKLAIIEYLKDTNKNFNYFIKLDELVNQHGHSHHSDNDKEELRKPLFAYMFYTLIKENLYLLAEWNDNSEMKVNIMDKWYKQKSNLEFQFSAGKVSIFLHFFNSMTKEAKPLGDPGSKVEYSIQDEFLFRLIMQSTGAIYQYQRYKSQGKEISKIDICKVMTGKNIALDAVHKIDLLSHTSLGSNLDSVFFNHQSFAELLLAEYYLKLIIKASLDKDFLKTAFYRLSIGLPTKETIYFLERLIDILVSTISHDSLSNRRLLFPVIASLCIKDARLDFAISDKEKERPQKKDERIDSIFYSKQLQEILGENFVKLMKEKENKEEKIRNYLENHWPIKEEFINRIRDVCKDIIQLGESSYLNVDENKKPEYQNALYLKDLTIFDSNEMKNNPPDIPKWIALCIGARLTKKDEFFASTIIDYNHLTKMIINWNYYEDRKASAPDWGTKFFKGLVTGEVELNLSFLNLSNLDFSNSNFRAVTFDNSNLSNTIFENSIFNNVTFKNSNLYHTNFVGCIFENYSVGFINSQLDEFINIPFKISQLFTKLTTNGKKTTYIQNNEIPTTMDGLFSFLILFGRADTRIINESFQGSRKLNLDFKILKIEEFRYLYPILYLINKIQKKMVMPQIKEFVEFIQLERINCFENETVIIEFRDIFKKFFDYRTKEMDDKRKSQLEYFNRHIKNAIFNQIITNDFEITDRGYNFIREYETESKINKQYEVYIMGMKRVVDKFINNLSTKEIK